jgi:hypothetical protein
MQDTAAVSDFDVNGDTTVYREIGLRRSSASDFMSRGVIIASPLRISRVSSPHCEFKTGVALQSGAFWTPRELAS